jgi:hypothetical protein
MPLDIQRTLFIGIAKVAGVNASIRTGAFFNALNLNEFTLVVWNAISLIDELPTIGVQFNTLMHPATRETFNSRYNDKIKMIYDWIRDGHVLLVYSVQFGILQYNAPDHPKDDLNTFAPFNLAILSRSQGQLVVASDQFPEFTQFVELFKCDYTLSGESGIPLFRTSSTRDERSEVAGAVFRIGKGAIVFSPAPRSWENENLVPYYDAVTKLPNQLNREATNAPEWTVIFRSKQEETAITRMTDLNKEISALTSGVTEQTAIITSEQRLKLLYSGTGEDLVSVVASALREVGLRLVEGPRRRADLLVWDGNRLAAAEVKGLDGTAREANHRQAVRWAADVNACLSATPD